MTLVAIGLIAFGVALLVAQRYLSHSRARIIGLALLALICIAVAINGFRLHDYLLVAVAAVLPVAYAVAERRTRKETNR